jgi:CTP:molybdopterin cytidylyltransferase MocA
MVAQREAIVAVVLAAGASSRFGSPKGLAPFRGKTLLAHVLTELLAESSIREVAVVVGAHADALDHVVREHGAHVHRFTEWERGMTASLREGVALAERLGASAALVCSLDQPAANRVHFARMIARRRAGASLVASRYEGALGIPVLFDGLHFAEISALSDTARGKDVVLAHARREHFADVVLDGGGLDVDTPEDLGRVTRALPEEAR